jgi:hypothetical protein
VAAPETPGRTRKRLSVRPDAIRGLRRRVAGPAAHPLERHAPPTPGGAPRGRGWAQAPLLPNTCPEAIRKLASREWNAKLYLILP